MNILVRFSNELKCFMDADDIILNYPNHAVFKNRVNLHYYHPDWQTGATESTCNLGDYLSEIIVRWMCKQKSIDFEKALTKTYHLYGLGSIIQMGYQNATLWGTGLAFELSRLRALPHRTRKLDIRCVRGPKTREILKRMGFDCPDVFGDPGVLMPLIYRPKPSDVKAEYLLIPHYQVEEKARDCYGNDYILSMNTTDYVSVINKICSSKKVISSSLHGIIIAESYGVPAVFYQDRPQRFNFKYEDWYESTDRKNVKPVMTVEEGVKSEPTMPKFTKIQELQNALVESFPTDLWE